MLLLFKNRNIELYKREIMDKHNKQHDYIQVHNLDVSGSYQVYEVDRRKDTDSVKNNAISYSLLIRIFRSYIIMIEQQSNTNIRLLRVAHYSILKDINN